MKLYSNNELYKLFYGNMLDMLDIIQPQTIDSIITDPPYELNFMGKGWDNSGIAFQPDTWKKCYEVLKPGGYLLAFGGSRTFHRIACAIEDAGFEIRDTIMWLYGSGFPKSMNISLMLDKREGLQGQRGIGGFNVGGIQEQNNRKAKLYIGSTTDGSKQKAYTDFKGDLAKQWQGWGTALKPSFEPIIVARKPFKGSLVDNVIEYGVGGINIDDCRVIGEDKEEFQKNWTSRKAPAGFNGDRSGIYGSGKTDNTIAYTPNGRFPANTILTYDETDYDEVCGGFPNTKTGGGIKAPTKNININNATNFQHSKKYENVNYTSDSGSASRYFYCAKASKKDRDEGLDEFEEKPKTLTENKGRTFNDRCAICGKKFIGSPETICHCENPITDKSKSAMSKNTHPTVKPTELMQYLVRLVTPNGGTVLDPFNGSGSTGKAVMYENKERNKNYKYIGIELTEEYLPIAKARIEYVCNLQAKELKDMQMSIFDLYKGE